MHKILLFSIFVYTLLCNCSARIDTTGFTDEDFSEMLDSIVEADKANLTPRDKVDLGLKLKQLRGLVKDKCPYYNLERNLTSFAVNLYNCRETLIEAGDWSDLTANEYVSLVCDRENWIEYLDCSLPVIQTYVSDTFRCFLGEEWIKPAIPGGLVDNVQYIFELSPKLLMALWEMSCANKDFMKDSFGLNNDFKTFRSIMRPRIESKDEKSRLRLGTCLMRNSEDKSFRGMSTFCSFASTIDPEVAYMCLLDELKNDAVATRLLKKVFPTMKFMFDKTKGGPTKVAFSNLVWNEFCGEGQLAKLLNESNNSPETMLKHANEQLEATKQELEETKNKLRASMKLISKFEEEMKASKLKKSKELNRQLKHLREEL